LLIAEWIRLKLLMGLLKRPSTISVLRPTKLAQRFLCPPPVEGERLFSQLKMIYTDKRNSLTGEHAEQQLFLRYIWSKTE
jgi:hypothetical protein